MKDHHHHEDSSHNDHREHHHNHEMSDIDSALSYIKDNLRGSSVRLGKRRKLQSGGSYSYQVDIYLEIDQQLVNDNGGILNPNTINYVNSIFTGANSIYEVRIFEINHCHIFCCLFSSQHLAPYDLQSEIDTHLSLLHIALTSNYNSASGTGNALDTMRSIYASQGFGYYPGIDCKKSTCSYHFPFGIVPHFCFVPLLSVHHALLSNNLGGGIAYLGVLCDSNYGFGLVSLSPALLLLFVLHQYFSTANSHPLLLLQYEPQSASLSGNFVSMSNSVVW